MERLVNPQLSGLPGFLTPVEGINDGFMVAQYAAAALVSENKVLAHPASVDSVSYTHLDVYKRQELGIRNYFWGPRRSPAATAAGSVGRVGAAECGSLRRWAEASDVELATTKELGIRN